MNKNLKRLRDRAAGIVVQMREISDKLAAEDRSSMTEEETALFQKLEAEAKDVKLSIEIEEKVLAHEKTLAVIQTGDPTPIETAEQKAIEAGKKKAAMAAISSMSGGQTFKHLGLVQQKLGLTRQDMNERAYASGQFLLSLSHPDEHKRNESRLWCQEHGIAYLAQQSQTNTAGGILIPEVLSDQIIVLRELYGVFGRFADRWPMTSDNLTIPRRTAGLTAYYVADGVSTTESQAAFDGVTLVAKELATLVRYPIALADDAVINLADYLTGEIAYAFALEEDTAGFVGDGTSTHGGIRGLTVIIDDAAHGNSVTTNGVITGGKVVAAAGHTGVGTLTLSDFENLVGLLPQYASANACWFMSRAIYGAGPQRLMDAGGGNTNETLSVGGAGSLTSQDPYGRPYRTFLGFPVIITQVMNSTLSAQASKIVALFGDLSLSSAIGRRKDIVISMSRDRYFEFRQIGLQGVQRFDIVNHDMGSGTAAGPCVALETSAT